MYQSSRQDGAAVEGELQWRQRMHLVRNKMERVRWVDTCVHTTQYRCHVGIALFHGATVSCWLPLAGCGV